MKNVILPAVVDMVKRFELYRADPYDDNGGRLAWGYGHSVGPPVPEIGKTISEEEAHRVLLQDLTDVATIISKWIHVDLNDYEFGACVSLAFNCGAGNFKNSHVLGFINDPTIKYHKVKAACAFLDHCKAKDKNTGVSREFVGLKARRIIESAFFMTPTTP